MKTPIHYCLSLGPSCHAAEFLRGHALALRRFALPFDYIHSDPAVICRCLGDGCKAFLDRRELAPWPGVGSGSLHRQLRTAEHAYIFNHHNPAGCDADFAHFHRAADRLRRVLGEESSRALMLHLEVNAAAGEPARDAFVAGARAIYASLRQRTSNFVLAAVRVVPRGAAEGGEHGAQELLLGECAEEAAGLLVLELRSLTRTVVPFAPFGRTPAAAQAAPEEQANERADLAALTAAIDARFDFQVRPEPPPATACTDAARAACGPRWVWAEPAAIGPRTTAPASELRRALSVLPGGAVSDADAGEVDVAVWAETFVAQAGAAFSARDWRTAAKRLATPSRRSATHADLVATVVGYQLAELAAGG